jgi:hypothetical protein
MCHHIHELVVVDFAVAVLVAGFDHVVEFFGVHFIFLP